MTCVIGTDIGTSSTKSVVVDVETGDTLVAASSAEYKPDSAMVKWSQQDAQVWMNGCFESIRKSLALAKTRAVDSNDVSAICISALNPGSGIPLERQLRPIHPA